MKLLRIFLLLFFVTACTVEDTAFKVNPDPPKLGEYHLLETSKIQQGGTNTTQRRRYNVDLKTGDAAPQLSVVFDEALGLTTTNDITLDKSGITLQEQDSKHDTWQFPNGINLISFPLHVGNSWKLDAIADRPGNPGEDFKLKISGTATTDRINNVRVHGRNIRVMVVDIDATFHYENSDLAAASEGLAAGNLQTSHKVSGELWYAPSYGMFVGAKYTDSFLGNKGSDAYEATRTWELTGL